MSVGRELQQLQGTYSICRLEPVEATPAWVKGLDDEISVVVRTPREVSIVCLDSAVPAGVDSSPGWSGFRVVGTLEHSLVGVLAAIAIPLAEAGVPIFALSSFETDYVLVPLARIDDAREALAADGFSLR